MKKLLLETSFSKIYMIVMIIITLLLVGGYFSYAMFTVSKEKSNAISIVTGNLTYKLEVDGEESNKLVVEPNSSKEFIVTLSNPNNRVARFNFYYLGDLGPNVTIGYLEKEEYNITPREVGLNLEKSCTTGSSNTYIIKTTNSTNKEITVELGVNVGLDYNDLTLPSNGHLIDKYSITLSNQLLVDKTNNLNYEDSEQTFITGNNPNNYIWYSGKLWRAVSIDTNNNSAKLVTEWNISAITFGIDSKYEGSYIEQWLNDTSVDGFLNNLRDYENFIVTDSIWDSSENYDNLGDIKRPNGTTAIVNPVGLLNLYEYQMSSGINANSYTNSYLNNGLYWWTLTPRDKEVYSIHNTGTSILYNPPDNAPGIRPVINIKSNIKVADGSGTEEDPYRLEGDNDTNLNGTLLNTRYSGEYIRFGMGENNLYRIVSHENGSGTKITSSEPLKENGKFKTIYFDTNNSINYSQSTTIGNFLNNDYLNPNSGYLSNEQINMIEDNTKWYLGIVGDGMNYKLAKYLDINMTNTVKNINTSKVGLLRMGELLSGQFERYSNIEDNSITNLTSNYWILTPYSEQISRRISIVGNLAIYNTQIVFGIKPALNLKSNVIITGGDGTLQNPFEIALQ